MAIPLNTHQISGIYACNQWFYVKQGTFYIDAFNLRQYLDHPGEKKNAFETPATDYQMGALYEKVEPEYNSGAYGAASNKTWCVPCGSHGCCFIDDHTGERVSFSLIEVKAFRERTDWPC